MEKYTRNYLYILLSILVLLTCLMVSCEEELETPNEIEETEASQLKNGEPDGKEIEDVFITSEISSADRDRISAAYKSMLAECIFEYIDGLLRNKNQKPYNSKGEITNEASLGGIMGLDSRGNLRIGGIGTASSTRLLQALKHEFVHIFQTICGTQLFGSDTGMAEFEVFVFLDILQYVNNSSVGADKHAWALSTKNGYGRFYEEAAEEYEAWLKKLTHDGTQIPPASAIDTDDFAKQSKNFGDHNPFYNNLGYTYGDRSFDPNALKVLLNYMNQYC